MISNEYAAGFFDGEGCVNLTVTGKSKLVSLRLLLVNTDVNILAAFKAQFGGFIISGKHQSKKNWKLFNQLTLTGNNAVAFLIDIAPHVRVKSAQVMLALEFWDYKHKPKNERCYYSKRPIGAFGKVKPEILAREYEFKQKMHELNRKGRVA